MKVNSADLRGINIFIVDDREELLPTIGLFLERQGARIKHSRSSAQAFRALKDFPADLGIWTMNGATEEEFAPVRSFRQMYSFQDVGLLPMIALSSQSQPDVMRKIFEEGFQAVLPKPVDERYLLEVVNSLASLHRQWAAEPASVGKYGYS